MALVVEQPIATFDLSEIARGDLVYGKHRTWPEGKAGFVTSATEKELIVQYHPGSVGNPIFTRYVGGQDLRHRKAGH